MLPQKHWRPVVVHIIGFNQKADSTPSTYL